MNPPDPLPRIAGIILAAGAATRMGQPKLLLPWKGEALVCHGARVALAAGLDPVVVVAGSAIGEMRHALQDISVQVVENPDWAAGQSTSVRAGIRALPENTQATFFLLGDQPYVTVDLLQALIKEYTRRRPEILAPYVGERRSNPVLFDCSIFDLLCQLQGDAGARSLFGHHPPAAMQWPDERLLFDIDTPEDYQKLKDV